jgi:hypothetical protein
MGPLTCLMKIHTYLVAASTRTVKAYYGRRLPRNADNKSARQSLSITGGADLQAGVIQARLSLMSRRFSEY